VIASDTDHTHYSGYSGITNAKGRVD
jgi:hypothetical protein